MASFDQYFAALEQFATREGHARVPVTHIETVNSSQVKLGPWVSYIRQCYRRCSLDESRQKRLAGLPGWEWGPLPPGPPTPHARDAQIRELREQGLSLQQIADRFNISRQRVHQIVIGVGR